MKNYLAFSNANKQLNSKSNYKTNTVPLTKNRQFKQQPKRKY